MYDEGQLRRMAEEVTSVKAPFGFTPRFAMKALPNRTVLRLFHSLGLQFDVSSGYEIERALLYGIPPAHLCLSSQELPKSPHLLRGGVHFNACSLHQLDWFGEHFPGEEVGVRINPGVGSGGHVKTNVAGQSSAFGIWAGCCDEAKEVALKHQLKIVRVHTHIGSGTDPAVWEQVAEDSSRLLSIFTDAHTLNLGGGFKVDRMTGHSSDLQQVGKLVGAKLVSYAEQTGRQIRLELEPGTHLAALAGVLLTTVMDKVHTHLPDGSGNIFLKLDAGMTEILRPTMYNAAHPFQLVPQGTGREGLPEINVSIVGHCCESGDLISLRDEAGSLVPTTLPATEIGDLLLVGGAGAYCSSMSAKNYNSFPEAPEVLLRCSGEAVLLRAKQTIQQMVQNEVDVPL